MKRNRRAPLSYATKQLVAHEIQIQKMRGQDDRPGDKEQLLSTKTPTMTTADEKEKAEEGGKTSASASGSNIPRHLQKLQAKELNVKASADLSRDPVDFFGRAIAPEVVAKKLKEDAANDKNSEIVSSDIWFKFKEGYNNAVRRNVKMKDLM